MAYVLRNGPLEGHLEVLKFCRESFTMQYMDAGEAQANTSGAESLGDQSPEEPVEERGRNLRSTISFPYTGLKDAEQIARTLHDSWGGGASPDQLAASLDASPRSGAFRTKIATSRTFRVISISRGNIALTDLGRKLDRPADARYRSR